MEMFFKLLKAYIIDTVIVTVAYMWIDTIICEIKKHIEKKKYEKIAQDYCLNPFKK